MLNGLMTASNSYFNQENWFPYYIFDIKKTISINSLSITGIFKGPLNKLLIYISEDGEHYSLIKIFNTTDLSINNYSIVLDKIYTNVRYIKIQSPSFSLLFIDSLFCNEINYPTQNISFEKEEKNICVFSCLYSEDQNFIGLYIENFLKFTGKDCYLIINLGDRYEYDDRYINNINKQNNRIFIYYGAVKRFPSGETLLRGHIESFNKAKEKLGLFHYFCTIASNSLFVTKFVLTNVIDTFKFSSKSPISTERTYQHDINIDINFPKNVPSCNWPWESLVNNKKIQSILTEDLKIQKYHISQIEGFFCSYNAWNFLSNLDIKIKNIDIHIQPYQFLPLEEIIPSSIIFENFPNEYTNICYMLWDGGRRVDPDFLCKSVPFLPQHISIMKWFDRSPYDASVNFINSNISDNLFSVIQEVNSNNKTIFFEEYLTSCLTNINKTIVKKKKRSLLLYKDIIKLSFFITKKLAIYQKNKEFFIHSERFDDEINVSILYKKANKNYFYDIYLNTMVVNRDTEIISYLYSDISSSKFIKVTFDDEVEIKKFVLFVNGIYHDLTNDLFKKINRNTYYLDLTNIKTKISNTYFLGIPLRGNTNNRFYIEY